MQTLYALAVSAFASAVILAPQALAAWWERKEAARAAEAEQEGY